MNKVMQGDCLIELKNLEENSVDSIVTDPPYELGFMGKSWDSTGIANNVELWKECLRVLKPGGHLLAFSGTRTYHRMASAIEDAGFEVRDMIEWVYGSGFPKSLNISKAIDKKGGRPTLTYEVASALKEARESRGITKTQADIQFCGGTTLYSWYEGRPAGIQLPTSEYMKKIASEWTELEKYVGLTMAAEREIIGEYKTDMGGLGGERLGDSGGNITISKTENAKQWEGWGTALKPAHEPICMARKPLAEKTVAENVLKYGTGGINIDESRVGTEVRENPQYGNGGDLLAISKGGEQKWDGTKETVSGRFPANILHDNSEEVRECFPETKGGGSQNGSRKWKGEEGEGGFGGWAGKVSTDHYISRDDGTGNASRFFKSIIYQAKSSKSERTSGGTITNGHPTIKPIALMEYLIKMVTPLGGIVLDPFAGSGSTLVAAKQNGFNYIGIEMTEEYIPIIEARLK